VPAAKVISVLRAFNGNGGGDGSAPRKFDTFALLLDAVRAVTGAQAAVKAGDSGEYKQSSPAASPSKGDGKQQQQSKQRFGSDEEDAAEEKAAASKSGPAGGSNGHSAGYVLQRRARFTSVFCHATASVSGPGRCHRQAHAFPCAAAAAARTATGPRLPTRLRRGALSASGSGRSRSGARRRVFIDRAVSLFSPFSLVCVYADARGLRRA
jgi:hypothetical protein